MPDPVTPDSIAAAAAEPQSVSADGQAVTDRPIADQIAAQRNKATADALSGPNDSGGPRSGWGRLRTARAKPPGAV